MASNEKCVTPVSGDCWHRKTVVIDWLGELCAGPSLYLPKGSAFRISRNDNFLLSVTEGNITCYQIEYYTGDVPDVWRSCWLLDVGFQDPAPSGYLKPSKKPVSCLEAYLPVAIRQDGKHVRHMDTLRMEYHCRENSGDTTDRVFVHFDLPYREGGAASGPPR